MLTHQRAENLRRQVSELISKIKKLETSVKNVEHAVMDGVFDVEQSIHGQIKLIAPDLDVFEIVAFKKVMDGRIVSIL
ncbi:hypothetical protein AHAS_Ahas13G0272700 [Arachis hypogaea]